MEIVNTDKETQEISDCWQNIIAENGLIFKNLGQTFESHYVRNGDTSKSALDHVYHTNSSIFSNSRKIENDLSDHFPVMLDITVGS